jgi:signal transduction histidine kinase/FixJ family two-component response regulator
VVANLVMDASIILVVDDEPGVALLCKRLLAREGYMVEMFTDPREAVQFLANHHIDLLLVDIRMPVVDGFEVIEHTQKLQPDSAILIMTGHGTVETAIRALRQGVDGLILKPFGQSTELIEAVKQAFTYSQQKRDAMRTKALRPLFAVTESLVSETNRERILELIINAVCEHLHCAHAAYYQQTSEESGLRLLCSRGKAMPELQDSQKSGPIAQIDFSNGPIMFNSQSSAASNLKSLLDDNDLGAIILAPIMHPSFSSILYAARNVGEPPFSDSDLELLQILGRQAQVALENSRLYAEQVNYVRKMEESQKALLQAEKMATAGRLSASIAHEINNPLQAVQNCLHLASREDFVSEKRKEYFDLARTELERLMLTIQRMLDFYRPGAALFEEINIGEVIQYVINLMSKQLSENGVVVKFSIPADFPRVPAVQSQLQQVFINLILNASDAMPNGGNLQITGQQVKDGVEILFIDNGPGVSLDNQANIFEPFFSTKEGGSGLGLTVSYNIINAHGGMLELMPVSNSGACFRIYLPTGGKR